MSDVKNIALASIFPRESVGLRPAQIESEEFQGLLSAIKAQGFNGAITVRPETRDGKKMFSIVDGLQRFTAAGMAGLTEIPCVIKPMSDVEVIYAQIGMNHHRVTTKPAEYSKALKDILAQQPNLTKRELATKLGISEAFLESRLNLQKLPEQIQTLLDDGKLTLANANALTKLAAVEEQVALLDQALSEPSDKFVQTVDARAKELAKAKKEGTVAAPRVFEPTATPRKKTEIEEVINNPSVIPGFDATNPVAAAKSVLVWALGLDPVSISEQKAAYDLREKAAAEAKAKREAEKKALKDAQAAAAAKVKADMEAQLAGK